MSPLDGVPSRSDRRGKTPRERVDGILLLDKPIGVSSNQAMMTARRLLAAAKAGHGGTLDPMATGLLPILFGEATKFAHDLLDADKTYAATLRLGQTSTTGDAEGVIADTGRALPDRSKLTETIARFTGRLSQRPPMYSALKHQGRPLYDYARSGIEVERAAREVVIHAIELLDFDGLTAQLRVRCSKGTYIRTLVADIGDAAGCGAWLTALRREAVDSMTIERAISLETLDALTVDLRRAWLAPIDALLHGLAAIELGTAEAVRFAHGQKLRVAPHSDAPASRVRVYGSGRLLGVAALEQGVLIPQRLIASESPPSSRSISDTSSPIQQRSGLRNQETSR